MKKLLAIVLALILCVSLAACGGASNPADDGPAGWKKGDTVYFHVPAKAGGGTDLYTRYLTQALGEVLPDVNFVVNNYENGEVPAETVKGSGADGLNLMVTHGGSIIQWLTGVTNVSIKDDLKVVATINQGGPQAIIAKPGAPYKNFTELKEYLLSNPGDAVIGCSLGGTTQMIFVSFVDALTGDSSLANYVQCAAEADKLTQVASSSIDIANCSIPSALAYEADGKLTILGTIGPKVSTLDSMSELLGSPLGEQYESGPEQGIESATWDSCYYVLCSPDTPEELLRAINEAILKAEATQGFDEGMKKMATFCVPLDYDQTVATLNDEWAFMDNLVTDMGLKTR